MRKSYSNVDPILIFAVLGLLIFGIIMIASIGVPKSIQLTAPGIAYPSCDSPDVECYYVLKNHVIRVLIGVVGMFLVSKISYRFWQKVSFPFFLLCFTLLILVLAFGEDNNTFAQSWFNIPSLPFLSSIQPSELAKLSMVIYISAWLQKRGRELETLEGGFIPFCIVSLAFIGPVLLQPDLGSTLVFACIAVGIYFAAGANIKHLTIGALVAVVIGAIMALSISHVRERFGAFFASDVECREDYCWQTEQAKIAVGSGGFFGRGLTQGVQKSYWLPQATDDFIFAASAEELGFVRTLIVVIGFVIVILRGYRIAYFAPDVFSRLLAVGVTTWIAAQVWINIAVNIALMPVTGITLPFVSYGGSSMFATLIGIGILLNISKDNYAYSSNRRGNGRPYTSTRTYY